MQTIDRHMKIEYPGQLTNTNKKEYSNKKTENKTKQDIVTMKMQPYIPNIKSIQDKTKCMPITNGNKIPTGHMRSIKYYTAC